MEKDLNLPPISWVNNFISEIPGFMHNTYFSPSMNREIGYAIYVPPDYHFGSRCSLFVKGRFPVIYWLHGKGGDESTGYNIRIPALFHKAVQEGKINPSLMVFPNCGSYSMFCDSNDGTIMGESILIKEIIPLIDANYKTIPENKFRGVEGFSMGGFGALKLAFKFPDIFSSVLTYGGSFHDLESVIKNRPEVFSRIFNQNPAYFQENSPYILAGKKLSAIKEGLKIRMVNGTADFTLQNNYKLNSRLDELGIKYEFKLLEGLRHIPGPYYEMEGINGFKFHSANFENALI